MGYKIKSLTNTLPKRDDMYMKTLEVVEQRLGFIEKKEIFPGQELFIKGKNLPINLHGMRLKGYVLINEVADSEFDRVNEQLKDESFKRSHPETENQAKLRRAEDALGKIDRKKK